MWLPLDLLLGLSLQPKGVVFDPAAPSPRYMKCMYAPVRVDSDDRSLIRRPAAFHMGDGELKNSRDKVMQGLNLSSLSDVASKIKMTLSDPCM